MKEDRVRVDRKEERWKGAKRKCGRERYSGVGDEEEQMLIME